MCIYILSNAHWHANLRQAACVLALLTPPFVPHASYTFRCTRRRVRVDCMIPLWNILSSHCSSASTQETAAVDIWQNGMWSANKGSLSVARYTLASAGVGSYDVFAGGRYKQSFVSDQIIAYPPQGSLVLSTRTL